MAFAGLETNVIAAIRAANLPDHQVLLLQLLLRGVHPWARSAAHASGLGTCCAGASRAQLVLTAHSKTAQPNGRLVREVCDDAAAGVAALRKVLPRESSLKLLERALNDVPAQITKNEDKKAAKALLRRVARHAAGLASVTERLFLAAWTAPGVDDRLTNVAAAEAAAILLLEGRDYDELVLDLQRLLRKTAPTASAVWAALLPPEKPFLAACLVEGTRGLQGLPGLLPGARQYDAAKADGAGWAAGAARLRQYAASQAPVGRLVCLVTAEVHARDRATAGWRLRRSVAEVLDQYVAGHRLADLRLLPETLVAEHGGTGHTEITARAPSVRTAYPLTPDWPLLMRESLRTAHLARVTDSPVARAALAWSAIEALGVVSVKPAPDEVSAEQLAAALALHHLRDRTMEAHHAIRQAAAAELAAAEQAQAKTTARLRSVLATASGPTPIRPESAAALSQAVAEARAETAVATSWSSELQLRLTPALDALEAYVEVHAGSRLLAGVNDWVRVLSPSRRDDPLLLVAAREALDNLVRAVGGSAARDVRACRALYAADAVLADELDLLQARGLGLLNWLYAARNLSVHEGVFALDGDGPLLAVGALNQLDASLEVLGNWFSHEASQPVRRRKALKASAAVEVLADRKDQAMAVLRMSRVPWNFGGGPLIVRPR